MKQVLAGGVPHDVPKAEAFIRGMSTLSVVCQGPFNAVATRLEALICANDMVIVQRHEFDRPLEGVCLGFSCRVYEIFNARTAGRLIALDEGVAPLLPWRIALHDRGGVSTVSTPIPTLLLREFSDSTAVAQLAKRFEAVLSSVLRGLR